MTKERVEKGLKRMDEWYDNHPDYVNPWIIVNEADRDVFVKALMDMTDEDIEFMDFETRKWFIEDEDKFQAIMDGWEKTIEVNKKFIERLCYYIDEYDNEKEETKGNLYGDL